MRPGSQPTDDDLLTSTTPDAFGQFYERRVREVLGEDVTIGWLEDLPPVQRAAIEAHVLEDRPYADIAGELGTSEVAVRMRVSRGLASLRGRLRSAR